MMVLLRLRLMSNPSRFRVKRIAADFDFKTLKAQPILKFQNDLLTLHHLFTLFRFSSTVLMNCISLELLNSIEFNCK